MLVTLSYTNDENEFVSYQKKIPIEAVAEIISIMDENDLDE